MKNKPLHDLELTKKKIRSKILFRLTNQKEEDRERKSSVIKQKLFHTLVFKTAKRVMFYIAFRGEVDTEEMVKEAQNLGKKIVVPVCSKKRSSIRPCIFKSHAHLVRGPYGVREPAIKRTIKLEDLDLVIVPGIAFDRKGNRLGRGKGYYDRFLEKLLPQTPTIGLAFDFQILPSLPATKSDIRVKHVIFAG